jgi:deoxyribodipyrimidine photolyase
MTETEPKNEGKRPRRAYHAALVAAFTRHSRVGDIIAETGLSRRTIQRWRADPENWREVLEAQSSFLADTLAKLRTVLPEIAGGLTGMALDREEPASVRLRAMLGTFEVFASLSQRTELEERLAALEKALAARRPFPASRSGGRTLLTAVPPPPPEDLSTQSK